MSRPELQPVLRAAAQAAVEAEAQEAAAEAALAAATGVGDMMLKRIPSWKRTAAMARMQELEEQARTAKATCHLPLATCHLPLATCHLPLE